MTWRRCRDLLIPCLVLVTPRIAATQATCEASVRAPWIGDGTVTYQLVNYPRHSLITEAAVRRVIQDAFNRWSAVIPVTFVPATEDPQITVGFYGKTDAPFEGFDGNAWENVLNERNVRGRALLGAGVIGFDNDEVWTESDLPNRAEDILSDIAGAVSQAANLDMVATHEIGHAIGLTHSSDPNDVMYGSGVRVRELSGNDRSRAQAVHATSKDWSCTEAMAAVGGTLYIVESGKLYRVDPATGRSWELPGHASGAWRGTDAMAGLDGALYIVANSRLHWVDTATGHWEQRRGQQEGAWPNTSAMAALDGALYIVQGSRLHWVDPATGRWEQRRGQQEGAWPNTNAMAGLHGALYIVQNSRLQWVDPVTGLWEQRSGQAPGAWASTSAMAAHGHALYIIQNDRLQWVDPTTGHWEQRPGQASGAWRDTRAMVALGDWLYVVQNGRLHRVDPASGRWMTLAGLGER